VLECLNNILSSSSWEESGRFLYSIGSRLFEAILKHISKDAKKKVCLLSLRLISTILSVESDCLICGGVDIGMRECLLNLVEIERIEECCEHSNPDVRDRAEEIMDRWLR